MRIRKGARCVVTDRSSLQMKVFGHGEGDGRRGEVEGSKAVVSDDVNQAEGVLRGPVITAPTSHGPSSTTTPPHHDLVVANGASGAGTERLENGGRVRRRLSADRRSRKRPPTGEGVISISSIIQAGVSSSARRNSTSAPASGESINVTSVASLANGSKDCSPSIAEKAIDRPNLLLESLKKVCSDAHSTGLTAKEAVAKILEQGLPGLIEGGERLIVQVAKLFRSNSTFVEREERGKYYIQESFQELMGWGDFEANIKSTAETETEKAIEAATQLAKLQSIQVEPASVGNSGTGRWMLALRRKGRGEKSNSQIQTSPSRDSDTGLRCNRDDGKGWRCNRFSEPGYSLCKYHREQIRRAEVRRNKSRTRSKKRRTPPMPLSPVSSPVLPEIKPPNPTVEEDVKKAVDTVPEAGKSVNESDNELPDHKRRRFVKAKSLMSL